jgi:polysaccharide biosynthesis transport protein
MNNSRNNAVVTTSQTAIPSASSGYYDSGFDASYHIRDYWHVFAKRKWWFYGILAGTLAITLLVIFLMPPIYKVTTTLQIIQDNPSAIMGGQSTDPLGALTGSSEIDRFYESQYNILSSPTLALGIIDSLNLKDHPSYKELEADNPDDPAWVIREKYAKYLLDHLKIEPVKNSYLVEISYRSKDKNLAYQIPQAIQKEYLKLSMNTRQQSYDLLRDWLNKELDRLGKKLEVSERNVFANGQQSEFLSLEGSEENVIIKKYIELSKLLTMAQSEKAAKEAQYRQIKENGADAPQITNHPLIQQLRQSLIEVEAATSGSNRVFGDNFPDQKVMNSKKRELHRRLNQEVKRLEASVKADYEAASRAAAFLQKDFDLQKTKVVDLQNTLVSHHILKRDLQTNQTLYEGLLARMKEASVASTMVASNVSVITPAKLPYEPWLPKPLLFMGLAMILGSMGGLGTAFFVEYLDSSVKTTEEMEKACRLPCLGVVPKFELGAKKESGGLIIHTDPTSMVSEAFYHIRAAVMLSISEAPPQTIVVTSANPNEGKTTISMNLSASLANSDRKCLIIDCDVRKPTVHKAFGQSAYPGLTNYLTGNASLEDIVRPTDVRNLYLIAAGPTPPNPNDLLNSNSFKDLIQRLRGEYDHLIIDSAPVIGFADGLTLANLADGVLFVVKHHFTTKEAGRLAVQLLSQSNARLLGCILSIAKKERLGYGGYYSYFSNYSKYYNKYHGKDDGKPSDGTKLLQG